MVGAWLKSLISSVQGWKLPCMWLGLPGVGRVQETRPGVAWRDGTCRVMHPGENPGLSVDYWGVGGYFIAGRRGEAAGASLHITGRG